MADFNFIRQIIEERVASGLAAYPIMFGNIDYFPQGEDFWIACTTSFGQSSYQAISNNGFDYTLGVVSISCFSRLGDGQGLTFDVNQIIKNLFNRKTISGIYFRPPFGTAVYSLRESQTFNQGDLTSAWNQSTILITFESE